MPLAANLGDNLTTIIVAVCAALAAYFAGRQREAQNRHYRAGDSDSNGSSREGEPKPNPPAAS
jgi:hypothetical protein